MPGISPPTPSIPIKLALRFILNIGDATDNPNEATYQGLVRDHYGNVAVPLPLLIMDIASGLRVNVPTANIDFQSGIVYLPVTSDLLDYTGKVQAENVQLEGRHLRFYYRADGDWSVQVSKAYISYGRKWGDISSVDYRSFIAETDDNGNMTGRLFFAACEIGKTVNVDYEYLGSPDGSAAASVPRKSVGRDYQTAAIPRSIDRPRIRLSRAQSAWAGFRSIGSIYYSGQRQGSGDRDFVYGEGYMARHKRLALRADGYEPAARRAVGAVPAFYCRGRRGLFEQAERCIRV